MASEKRLIDANAYCKELYAERDYPGRTEEFISALEVAIADLGDMPTVDAVEVVRCKDCKWWHDMKCTNINGANCLVMNENWFCCSGERKDNG